jgi:hypothetical protein
MNNRGPHIAAKSATALSADIALSVYLLNKFNGELDGLYPESIFSRLVHGAEFNL